MKFHMVNLGCAKNRVDGEIMAGKLLAEGIGNVDDPDEADIIVVNTCSFIKPAADESIDTILEMVGFKEDGDCKKIVVTGCLPQRYGVEIASSLPEVDVFLGTGAYGKIVEAVSIGESTDIQNDTSKDLSADCLLPDPDTYFTTAKDPRALTETGTAYIKAAEGCGRRCTFCIIPDLRGKYRSRTIDDIEEEARILVDAGTKEIILVSQETTAFGHDRHDNKNGELAMLLKRLSKISNDTWIRFLYGHPESIDDSIIDATASLSNVCAYFDVPIQHASTSVLKRMGRNYNGQRLITLFENIRKKVPEAALRTTVITGFPGETDQDFQELLDFIGEVKFDHLGAFVYSDSEDLPSHRLKNRVETSLAEERRDALMMKQAEISLERNKTRVGKTCTALCGFQAEDGVYAARTMFQAPEVDGITFINETDIKETRIIPGEFVDIKITDAGEYDLIGEPV